MTAFTAELSFGRKRRAWRRFRYEVEFWKASVAHCNPDHDFTCGFHHCLRMDGKTLRVHAWLFDDIEVDRMWKGDTLLHIACLNFLTSIIPGFVKLNTAFFYVFSEVRLVWPFVHFRKKKKPRSLFKTHRNILFDLGRSSSWPQVKVTWWLTYVDLDPEVDPVITSSHTFWHKGGGVYKIRHQLCTRHGTSTG